MLQCLQYLKNYSTEIGMHDCLTMIYIIMTLTAVFIILNTLWPQATVLQLHVALSAYAVTVTTLNSLRVCLSPL